VCRGAKKRLRPCAASRGLNPAVAVRVLAQCCVELRFVCVVSQ